MRKSRSWWTVAHAEALKRAIARYGTQAQLIDKIKINRSSLIEILAARSAPKRETLDKICAAIGIDPEEILAVAGIDEVASEEAGLPKSVVLIQELDQAYGLGATFVDSFPVTETGRYFPSDWVRSYTKAPPDQLRFAPGKGNSMSPTIDDGDIMLIDLTEKTPNFADLIWVCTIGPMGMVKRLALRSDGGITLKSDNPNVRDDVAYDGELTVIGRVVAVIKKV